MIRVIATVVDGGALLKVVAASFAAAIVLTLGCSAVIFGAVGYADTRSEDRSLQAGGFALLSIVGLLITVGVVVFGLVAMLSK